MNTPVKKETVEGRRARLRSTQRDCPNCDSILVKNESEECYECLDCGYIDCSHANEEEQLAKVS